MAFTALNAVSIAESLVRSGNSTMIVLEVDNAGSSSRWSTQFPSLQDEVVEMLGEATFLEFADEKEAFEVFQRLQIDSCASDNGSLVSGTITLVSRPHGEDDGVETRTWTLEDESMLVHEAGRWTYRDIPSRL